MSSLRLVSNPFALIDLSERTDGVKQAWTYAPLRGRAAIERELRADYEPGMVTLMERIHAARGPVSFAGDEIRWLTELGFLVRRDEIPDVVPVACPITRERLEALSSAPPPSFDAATWIVHPELVRWESGAVPPWFAADARWWGASADAPVLAWTHPGTGLASFCQLEEELPALVPGQAPGGREASVRGSGALARLGLVVPPDFVEDERLQWERGCAQAREDLAAQGWHALPELLPDFQRVALSDHLLAMQRAGFLSTRSAFAPLRHTVTNDPWITSLHRQMKPLIERLSGRTVLATSGYGMIYEAGADLPPHIDRPECDLAVSLLLSFEPETESPAKWPLFVASKPDRARAAINTVLGRAVLYEGRAVAHWRERLPDDHRVMVAIFCYRRLEGPTT